VVYGISGATVPTDFPYAAIFNRLGQIFPTFPPMLLASIAWRETLSVMPPEAAATCVSGDNGHGVCQLTTSWPDSWQDPETNIRYAWVEYVQPAIRYWHGLMGYAGEPLVKLVAATYNEGLAAAITYHNEGNVDAGTTNDYGNGVLQIYQSLVSTGKPPQ
jgi:hypothetical protein